ncbi:alpha/beta fold hydrolase [Azohydromonas sediminis]|uniref:alpha/beta fold hydrolase n=1 Tax=Azohydromonas sediminis TaxID=2259674 RepID=UPI000E659A52|nr:alpha/beta fold hydrolase [Azohydromonas sediminis]
MGRSGAVVGVALLAAALGALWLAGEYRRDLREQHARVASGSRVVATACGAVEVAEAGPADGAPLLVIHGSGGGFDQGLTLGADYAALGYRVIAPSRFGYLRTPMPADPSGEHQADHLACLLDALGVRAAAVMGVSAGAVSALHFALRHPQRTRALVLMVPAVYRPDPAVPMPHWALAALDAVIGADAPFWLLARFAPDVVRRLVLATPPAVYHAADANERGRADTVLHQILPVSARRLGLLNDSRLTTGAARVALEAIGAPTLAISARDDGFGTFESARYSAAHIPGARFVGFERGGHLLLGHQREVVAAVHALLRAADDNANP